MVLVLVGSHHPREGGGIRARAGGYLQIHRQERRQRLGEAQAGDLTHAVALPQLPLTRRADGVLDAPRKASQQDSGRQAEDECQLQDACILARLVIIAD